MSEEHRRVAWPEKVRSILALDVRIVTTFPRGDRTPASILWEGVVEVINPEKQNDKGYPERVIKGQVKVVKGQNGLFIGTPSRKTADGRYFNYFDLGPSLQRLILPVLQAAMDETEPLPEPSGDLTSAAADEFADLPF